jgi:hypothetical protein
MYHSLSGYNSQISTQTTANNYGICFRSINNTESLTNYGAYYRGSIQSEIFIQYSAPGYPLRSVSLVLNMTDRNQTVIDAERAALLSADALLIYTKSISLPLLSSSDGIDTSIQVSDIYTGNAISGAEIEIYGLINNTYTLISSDTTGLNGISKFLLGNYKHRILVEAEGYESIIEDFNPSSSVLPIRLTPIDGYLYSYNITNISAYYFLPQSGLLNTNTSYNFSMFINKTANNNVIEAKIDIYNGTTLLNTSSFTASSAYNNQFGLVQNTSSYPKLTAKYYIKTSASSNWILVNTNSYMTTTLYEGKNSLLAAIKSMATLRGTAESSFTILFVVLLLLVLLYAGFTYYTGIDLQTPGVSMSLFTLVIIMLSAGDFLTVDSLPGAFMGKWGFALLSGFFTLGHWIVRWRES